MMYDPVRTAGELGFDSGQKQHVFLFFTASRPAPEPTQRSNQGGLRSLSLGVKRLTTHLRFVPRLRVRVVYTHSSSHFHGFVLS
jgi:hypothetical protein